MTSPPDRWARVLDELEQRIGAQEDVLELASRGRQPGVEELLALISFAPPADLPRIPADIAPRARDLLARAQTVQDRLAELIETNRPSRAPRARAARRSSATTLDIHA